MDLVWHLRVHAHQKEITSFLASVGVYDRLEEAGGSLPWLLLVREF
jgi:hypothetical protein